MSAAPPQPDLTRDHADAYADGPPLAVDRRRIIQSAAFRRLQHKTQVFVAGRSDHFRTRLAHTLEVADLARGLATRLGLEAELAEAAALAHDLGHAPFGHAGERALDACFQSAWRAAHSDSAAPATHRFEHNAQSLRVVEHLEHPYPAFRGLNLTRAVRNCLRTHETRFDRGDGAGAAAPLEGQVAARADELTYLLHDLQDGVYAGLLEPHVLAGCRLWTDARVEPDEATRGEFADTVRTLRPTVDRIRAGLLDAVAAEFERQGGAAGGARVTLPADVQRDVDQLGALLLDRVYRHPTVARMDAKARRIITAVFDAYVENPRLLPRRYAARIEDEGLPRVAIDYIAGMTDRFCQDEHARLFDARMEP